MQHQRIRVLEEEDVLDALGEPLLCSIRRLHQRVDVAVAVRLRE